MFYHRKAEERGHLNFGWLDTRHSFSFGSYFDPQFMGFSSLRVINDDSISGGAGFEAHPHREMEIVTFVKEGALEHKDSLGASSVIRPGEIQIMSAGTGVWHSEFNHLENDPTKFYQIWIQPDVKGVEPRYEQIDFSKRKKENGLTLLVSPDGNMESASINASVNIYLGSFDSGNLIDFEFEENSSYWVQIISGEVEIGDAKFSSGDGLAVKDAADLKEITAKAASPVSFLLFHLP